MNYPSKSGLKEGFQFVCQLFCRKMAIKLQNKYFHIEEIVLNIFLLTIYNTKSISMTKSGVCNHTICPDSQLIFYTV